MNKGRLIIRHVILSIAFVVLYLALNQPPVILISQLGSVAWYPATGLVLAVLLGISPWYAILVCFVDALAGALIYHQPLLSFGETVGSVGVAFCYCTAAYILRGPLQIDLGLRRAYPAWPPTGQSPGANFGMPPGSGSPAMGLGCWGSLHFCWFTYVRGSGSSSRQRRLK